MKYLIIDNTMINCQHVFSFKHVEREDKNKNIIHYLVIENSKGNIIEFAISIEDFKNIFEFVTNTGVYINRNSLKINLSNQHGKFI